MSRESVKANEGVEMDYFATQLLESLDRKDPLFAAYEAQDVSRQVGFDFADFDAVVPRALDEIRETKEAYLEEGDEGREHFGDEVADIMFSFVNLARHAGVEVMPKFEDIETEAKGTPQTTDGVMERVDDIARQIKDVANVSETDPSSLRTAMEGALRQGLTKTVEFAVSQGFDARKLLTENVRKYLVRCLAIEQLAKADNKSWADLSAKGEIITYWKNAKSLLN